MIAAIDATTGAVTAWNPNLSSGYVSGIAVGESIVYVRVRTINKSGGPYQVAAINAGTGATVWTANADGPFQAMAVSGPTVYVGGRFTAVGGASRNLIAALDATTGTATAWNPDAFNDFSTRGGVMALAVSGSIIYAGGQFRAIGGVSRNYIAAIDAATGMPTAWNPNANADVRGFDVSGSIVYVAGSFGRIGGEPRAGIAAIDAATGATSGWNPDVWPGGYGPVAASGNAVYAGGLFRWGVKFRDELAAIDAASGIVTSWYPDSAWSSHVFGMVARNSTIYVGGQFSRMGGQARSNIAAIDATTGAATDWSPQVPSEVYALAVSGSTIYASGGWQISPTTGGGWVAGFDAATGATRFLNQSANKPVMVLAVSGSTVYAGGTFTRIDGQDRGYIASFDATTGAVTTWNPTANGSVSALAVDSSTLYAGGSFTTIGGAGRNRLAAFDVTTGMLGAWNPSADDAVAALAVDGSAVYAGGWFGNVGGQARNRIAALDATTGAAIAAWDLNVAPNSTPTTRSYVRSLARGGSTLYAGGDFSEIGGAPRRNFAAIGPDGPTSILLSLVGAHATSERVDLTWYAPTGDVLAATIYRRTDPDDWEIMGQVLADGAGWLRYRDAHVAAGTRYCYRLGIMDDGEEVFAGETWVEVPALQLALRGATPNPTVGGRLQLEFTLGESGPAKIELIDISGRIVRAAEVGSLGPGPHSFELPGDAQLRAGIYFLRLRQGGREARSRVAIVD